MSFLEIHSKLKLILIEHKGIRDEGINSRRLTGCMYFHFTNV